jgi:hypothetical protein
MRAITSVIEGLGDRIAYLYSGSPEMLAPVVVVQDPVPCQPIKIATTISKPGIRVCFHWCRKLPKAQLDAALRELDRPPAIAPLVAGVREADYLKGPLLPFAGTLEQPGAVETLTEALRTLVQA